MTEPCVLVVDDDDAIRHLVQSVLQDEGYRVLCAADVESALEAAKDASVRLILLDLLLHGQSGTDFLDRYLERATPPAPVVLLTAWGLPIHVPQGVVGRLLKPFDIDDLIAIVQEQLRD